MKNPNASIYSKLNEITGVNVYRSYSESIEQMPSITYYVLGNAPSYSHSKQVNHQTYTISVDIWTRTPDELSTILAQVEAKMIEIDFRLINSNELDFEKNIFRVNAVFSAII